MTMNTDIAELLQIFLVPIVILTFSMIYYKSYILPATGKNSTTLIVVNNTIESSCPNPNCIRCLNVRFDSKTIGDRLDMYCESVDIEHEQVQRLYDACTGKDFSNALKSEPTVLYVPGITGKPIWNPSDIQLVNPNPNQFSLMRSEYDSISAIGDGNCWVTNETPSGTWHLFYLYNQGKQITDNCRLCPNTLEYISSLQGSMLDSVFGNVAFSVLLPGTIIEPHTGSTNAKLRSHLALQSDSAAFMRVSGDVVRWVEGEWLLFDDSFIHEVHHHGDKERVVLMVDFWHPDLNKHECQAIKTVYQT